MANGLLIGHDKEVTEWVRNSFRLFPMHLNRAIGVIGIDGSLVGAILFSNYNSVNVDLSYYGPKTVSLGVCRSIARIALGEFNAARVSAVTSKRNKRLIWGLQKVGFKIEGAQRCYYGHKDCTRNTGIRLVMFRDKIEAMAGLKATAQKAV